MSPRQPLQLDLLRLSELELPAALHQGLQEGRHQNLTPASLRGYPCRQDDGLTEEVLALLDGLAGVKADANLDGLTLALGTS